MKDARTYTSTRAVSGMELVSMPAPPSDTFREIEAGLVGELARNATLDGRRFEGWPTITLAADCLRDAWTIRAEVTVR